VRQVVRTAPSSELSGIASGHRRRTGGHLALLL
jgi:hypothetical protein